MPACSSLAALVLLTLACGCGDKTRRLSEQEALNYKTRLLASHVGEISPQQQNEFMRRAERTEAKIDAVFDQYRERFAAQKAADEARFESPAPAATESGSGPPR